MTETDIISDAELDQIVARCDAATPGPWQAWIEGRDHESGSSFVMTAGDDIELTGASHADYDFIASARQDILRRVAEIRRLRTSR